MRRMNDCHEAANEQLIYFARKSQQSRELPFSLSISLLNSSLPSLLLCLPLYSHFFSAPRQLHSHTIHCTVSVHPEARALEEWQCAAPHNAFVNYIRNIVSCASRVASPGRKRIATVVSTSHTPPYHAAASSCSATNSDGRAITRIFVLPRPRRFSAHTADTHICPGR